MTRYEQRTGGVAFIDDDSVVAFLAFDGKLTTTSTTVVTTGGRIDVVGLAPDLHDEWMKRLEAARPVLRSASELGFKT